jgi:signal peptidase I
VKLDSAGFLTMSTELLSRGHQLRFQALGSSMLPFIRSGQVIQVAPVQVEELRLHDVIFYRIQGPRLVAHRLVKKEKTQGGMKLLARGDSCSRSDVEVVESEQILGRVVSVELWKGKPLRIDAGWGRLLGIWLARISPSIRWIYPLLSKLKGGVAGCWGCSWNGRA